MKQSHKLLYRLGARFLSIANCVVWLDVRSVD
jgi:hypothetical protein